MKNGFFSLATWLIISIVKAQSPTCNIGNIIQTYQTQSFTQFQVGGQPCHLYFYNNNDLTWQAAENIAVGLGSHLASVTSQAENDSIVAGMLAAGIPSNTVVWIGYSDQASEGNWVWIDGSQSAFSNWNNGEPNNSSGFPGVGENGGQLQLSNGRWNDLMTDNVGLFPAPTGKSIIKVNLCPQITVSGNSGCANQPITLTANNSFGSQPQQNLWFLPPSTTPLATGPSTYTVNVATSTVYVAAVQDLWGCSDTAQVLVSVTPCIGPPGCDLQAIDSTMQAGGYLKLNVQNQPCSRYFYNSNATANWATAEQQAQAVGGHLVTINSAGENADVLAGAQAASLSGGIWIGYTDQAVEGSWVWSDGTQSAFTNWNAGEPSNSGGLPCYQDEDGAIMQLSNGFWNDLAVNNICPGASQFRSVIEIDLCPVTNINAPSGAQCQGQPVQLSSTTILGSPAYNYQWTNLTSGQGVGTNASSITVTPNANTSYQLQATDRYGCYARDTAAITTQVCVGPQGCRLNEIDSVFQANGYIKLNGVNNPCSRYFINPTSQSSTASEAQAQLLGAHMVSIQSAQENAEVTAALTAAGYNFNNPKIWMGLTDVAQEGTFVWLDQNSNAYSNWFPGEPNNQVPSGLFNCCQLGTCQSQIVCSQGEDCVQFYPSGQWNDQPCDLPAISVIEVNLCPVVTATTDTLVCENSSLTLTASTILGSNPYTYSWTPGGTGSSVTVTPSAATTYTVRSTDRYGCYIDEAVNVTTQTCVQPPVSTCNISQIISTFTGAGYQQLNGVVGQDCSMYFINPTSQDANLSEADAQQLGAHLVVFNDAAENQAVVAALNNAGIISANSAVWVGYTDQASEGNWVTLDGTPMSYLNWNAGEPNNNGQGATCCSFPDFLGGCQNSQALQCAEGEDCMQIYSSGTWNDLPCNRQSVSVIEVNLCPQITTNNDTSICASSPLTLSASTILGSNPYSYNWTPGGNTTNSVSVSPTVNTQYVVLVTDRYSCTARDTINVTILGGAAQSFTITPTPVCVGAPATVTYTGASSTNATYTWSFDGGTQVSGSGQGPYTIEWSTAGVKNLTLDVVDGGCTVPQVSQSVTVNNNPLADAGVDTVVCSGGSVQLGSVSNPSYAYLWNPSANLSSDIVSDPDFSSSNPTQSAVVISYVLGVSENGCVDFDTVDVTLNPVQPTTISASGPLTFCEGGNVTLVSDSVYNAYLWSDASTSNSLTVTQSGQFFMAGEDAAGCQYLSNTLTVTVNPSPVLSLQSSTDESCFGNGDGSITVSSTSGTSPFTISWSDGQTGSTASNLTAGSYDVIILDGNQCSDTATYSISSPAQIFLNIDSIVDASCFGTSDGSITVSATGGVSPFSYSWSNGSSQNIISNLSAGSYSVTVSDFNNCTETASATVTEPAEVIVTSLQFDSIRFGDNVTLPLNVQPAGSYTYQWNPANYLSCVDCSTPVFSAIRSIEYTVTVTDASGCTVTANVSVTVDGIKNVFVPNVFTPNGDNANDVFTVFVNNVSYYNLMIFNRSGEKVYDSFNETQGWDGFYRGKEAPPGVYVYVLNITFLDGVNQKLKGAVTLLR